ncbi:hypothetical protein ACFO1B_40240 [Dactylosporangium siamense]|uniref:Uncharacterized protein n=1 Tax=Dactylosporangium siamense TaxID=685454 RepID=A0A919PTQ5_9ACTN|nr:hypothetical protein [Dactylosporangium siamense]GIG50024.1 hypothetical protein Dsi01nite_080650 [Dactylosporangium siamense]
MLGVEELRKLCEDFRYNGRETDDDVVEQIRVDVQSYRDEFFVNPVPQVPPPPLLERLPLMGWLIYEASWQALQQIKAAFESLDEARRIPSVCAYRQVKHLANAARGLVWPEFAGRALGGIRAHALAESKRDTEEGYDEAYIVHLEVAERHQVCVDSHGNHPDRVRYLIDLDEVVLQIALAETGTACRTAERVIGRWSEQFADEDEQQWVQRMYGSLANAVNTGERALGAAKRIRETYPPAFRVDEFRLSMVTGARNPGIMTARAILLFLALGPAMEAAGRKPTRAATWSAERSALLGLFTRAYRMIEALVIDDAGRTVPLAQAHQRALVQLRLNLALLVPGHSLPSLETFAPCLKPDPLDDHAVEVMSVWLASKDGAGGPNHGSAIGAATLPLFVQSVIALRSLTETGDGDGYQAWRRTWFELGRFAGEPGRRDLVGEALEIAASRRSLRIGSQ